MLNLNPFTHLKDSSGTSNPKSLGWLFFWALFMMPHSKSAKLKNKIFQNHQFKLDWLREAQQCLATLFAEGELAQRLPLIDINFWTKRWDFNPNALAWVSYLASCSKVLWYKKAVKIRKPPVISVTVMYEAIPPRSTLSVQNAEHNLNSALFPF